MCILMTIEWWPCKVMVVNHWMFIFNDHRLMAVNVYFWWPHLFYKGTPVVIDIAFLTSPNLLSSCWYLTFTKCMFWLVLGTEEVSNHVSPAQYPWIFICLMLKSGHLCETEASNLWRWIVMIMACLYIGHGLWEKCCWLVKIMFIEPL